MMRVPRGRGVSSATPGEKARYRNARKEVRGKAKKKPARAVLPRALAKRKLRTMKATALTNGMMNARNQSGDIRGQIGDPDISHAGRVQNENVFSGFGRHCHVGVRDCTYLEQRIVFFLRGKRATGER